MKKYVHASNINGSIVAPPSKSQTIRALAGALLSDSHTVIINPSICNDTLAAISIIKSFGAQVHISENSLFIKGAIKRFPTKIDCGESATCLRIFAALKILTKETIIYEGNGSLLNREFTDIVNSLKSIGLKCDSKNGCLPIKISGKFKTDDLEIDCSQSSQFLTGILLGLPLLETDTKLRVSNLVSKPYVDMTIDILRQFNIKITRSALDYYYIEGNQKYISPKILSENKFSGTGKIEIEGDWSAAAFTLVAGAVGGSVSISGLNLNSYQGDKKVLEILDICGSDITINNKSINIRKNELNGFVYDVTNTPDLFPALITLALNCKGQSRIVGANRLKNKESDRVESIKKELNKLGAKIKEEDDALVLNGKHITGGKVFSHNDHRIAMALAIAGINADGPVIIENAECVAKSYPEFYNDLQKIGVKIHE